jgi:hypothetical protein
MSPKTSIDTMIIVGIACRIRLAAKRAMDLLKKARRRRS